MKRFIGLVNLVLIASACSKTTPVNTVSDGKGIGSLPSKELVCELAELKSGVLTQLAESSKTLAGTEVAVDFDETKISKDLSAGALLNGDQLSLFFDLKLATGKVSSSTITDQPFARLSFVMSGREFVLGCEVSRLGLGSSPKIPTNPAEPVGPSGAAGPTAAVGPTAAI